MSIDVNVQNDLVIVTETTEDIVVNVSNAAGPQGPAGPAGQGVPVGGTTNQVLKKLSNTNYDTYWAVDNAGVPYSGASGDVNLGAFNLTATSLIKSGGTSSQFLKADGSVDSSTYITGITSGNVTTALGFTPVNPTRSIATTSPLVGGGDLSADRTLSIPAATTSVNGYLTSTDWTTFNNKQASGNYITALTGEVTASGPGSASATLLNSAVIGKLLTGLNLAGGGTIAATDSILQAFGKTQNQISALVGGVMYEGVWNASTNSPAIVSSVGSKGDYYVVIVAGSTNIDGITDWKVGDWIIYNGTTWDKVDNTDAVSSVNGFTGAVSLTTANISEVTNLYYTEGRVSANTDVAANTASRHNAVTLGTANGLSLSTQALSLALASGSTTGALSSTDWTTFNNKQNTITNPVTGTGTTNYLPKWTSASALGDSNLQTDIYGNLGLGIANSAWLPSTGRRAIEIGALGNAMFGNGASDFYMLSNAYTDGTFKYANNGPASSYRHADGSHIWYQAPSGTAGNAISFTQAMTLNAGGNLLVGTQVDTGERLQVSGSVLATSFIKSGGTSAQILAADGSVITAGTNITISGGTISSSGGGGSVDELQVALICQVFG